MKILTTTNERYVPIVANLLKSFEIHQPDVDIIVSCVNTSENSIKYLEKSLSSKSTNPMIYNNLGISFMEIFEFEKAKENFNLKVYSTMEYINRAFDNLKKKG